ncbi:MAG TPA: Hsp20/alpha crystallin family protein [Terriglobales bacterium]|nr:Hsp20/alpha crystallin family protein [Terriglobales bacterium]
MTTNELTPSEKKEVSGYEQVRQGRYFVPDVDIREDENGLRLYADVPGADPEKISVEIRDDVLSLQGEVNVEPYQGLSPIYTEYKIGHYLRRFTLPRGSDYDQERISARLVDGVLEVELPKAERAKPRRIAITTTA